MKPDEIKDTAMNCSEFEILLCDYVDGTLDAPRKQALEAHQRECAACAEFARRHRALDSRFSNALIPPELSANFRSRLKSRIRRESPSIWRSQHALR